jgi:phosphomannomutase
MAKVECIFAGYNINKTNGLKILGDKYWIHNRKNGTEPIIRVYVESYFLQRSQELCRETIGKLVGK